MHRHHQDDILVGNIELNLYLSWLHPGWQIPMQTTSIFKPFETASLSGGAKRIESLNNISFNVWLTYLELPLKPRTFWQWSLKKRGASFCSNQNNQNYLWFFSLTCGKAMKLPETRLFPHDKRLGAKKGPFRWYSDTGLRKIGKLDAQTLW